jgi:hypothetical protein
MKRFDHLNDLPKITAEERARRDSLLRLRDAAPDLLEALKRIAHGLRQDARTADGWTKADAIACAEDAIAKAEGSDR